QPYGLCDRNSEMDSAQFGARLQYFNKVRFGKGYRSAFMGAEVKFNQIMIGFACPTRENAIESENWNSLPE
uniref:Peptidase M12A domain-containing protein n=1 Tax=Globodera pallida TaxID=36090 RepID=A0A183CTP2_GLOPA